MVPVAAVPPLHTGASFDVIVVGAGAAGAATAMLLARRAVRTLLLERDEVGTGDASTHILTRAGVLLLARWGVLDRVIAAGTPPIRRTTYRYDGERVVMSVLPSHGVDALDVADRIARPHGDGADIADELRRLNSAMAAEVDTLTTLEPWRTT